MEATPATAAEAGNSKFPLEILGAIFLEYAENDNASNPVEKLLLVCRTWSAAAILERSIWTTFRIRIKSERDIIFWNGTLPRRLALYSGASLLDIRVTGKWASEKISSTALRTGSHLWRQIAGENGEISRHWKRFACTSCLSWVNETIISILCFPTPNLQKFVWIEQQQEYPLRSFMQPALSKTPSILPSAPNLRTWVMSSYILPSVPAFRTVEHMCLSDGVIRAYDATNPDTMPASLISLRLVNVWRLEPKWELKVLETLEIEGECYVAEWSRLKVPNLKYLTLNLAGGYPYKEAQTALGFQLGRLREMTIYSTVWNHCSSPIFWINWMRDGLEGYVDGHLHIKKLRVDWKTAALILLIMEEESFALRSDTSYSITAQSYGSHKHWKLIVTTEEDKEVRGRRIRGFRSNLGISELNTWEKFYYWLDPTRKHEQKNIAYNYRVLAEHLPGDDDW